MQAAPGAPPQGSIPGWAFGIIGLVGLLFVILVVIVLRNRGRRPGRAGAAGTAAAGGGLAVARQCTSCGQNLLAEWAQCPFCGTVAPALPAQVEFILGPLSGQVISLQQEVTTFGSQQGNSVVLADPAVSKKHAGIRRDGAGYELADFGSTNGVYINGQRTAKKALAEGDVIRVGTSEMVFHVSGKVG